MKKFISTVLVLFLLCAISIPVLADHLQGADGWTVTFTASGTMESNFQASGYTDEIKKLQPGDDITLTVSLLNKNSAEADWYMSNTILTSLEDSSNASGGAYEYELTYSGPGGSKTLYSSTTVGGIDSDGLHEATNALENFFYLDTIPAGGSGTVKLIVKLDGETQGNNYADTLAELKMDFAVEYNDQKPVVVTGDPTKLLPYFIALGVSGAGILALAIVSVRRRRKEKKEEI